ncbi:MAG: LysM peptidoglycan-binding domain-containing protein [Lachnospiraceae bacterium]|nr:LysM peptidoglycan-binding domain-containing protein [Lachnospiraceae bacterium]
MRRRIGVILAVCGLLAIGCYKVKPADLDKNTDSGDGSKEDLSAPTDSFRPEAADSLAGQIFYENCSDSPYWLQVKELLNAYITDDVYMDVTRVTADWSEENREIENPPKDVFEINLCWNDFPGTHDEHGHLINNFVVLLPHCNEERGRFVFWVWIESDGEKDIIKTDFPQQLYSNILANVSSEMTPDVGRDALLGYSPSHSGYEEIPYYELMEEPMVMWKYGDDENMKVIFRAAYERMHEWQSQIDGDLTQTVRYCNSFDLITDNDYISGNLKQGKSQRELEVWGYWYWLDEYEMYFPEHELSFYSEYGEEQKAFFEVLIAERLAYLGRDKGPENTEDERTYTVQKGDTLWQISVWFYGDGSHYREIWEENRDVIGDDMNYILPGMILRIPD